MAEDCLAGGAGPAGACQALPDEFARDLITLVMVREAPRGPSPAVGQAGQVTSRQLAAGALRAGLHQANVQLEIVCRSRSSRGPDLQPGVTRQRRGVDHQGVRRRVRLLRVVKKIPGQQASNRASEGSLFRRYWPALALAADDGLDHRVSGSPDRWT